MTLVFIVPDVLTMALFASWQHRFTELLAFQREKGHCLVPQRCKENPQLGTWVHTQVGGGGTTSYLLLYAVSTLTRLT